MERILVSACLMGRRVRYDGGAKTSSDERLAAWLREGRLVPFCPEVEGGLAVPRPAAEIEGGAGGAAVLSGAARVLATDGSDVTAAFVTGARAALEAARACGARLAVLKEGSPSCGALTIYDGTFSGAAHPGPRRHDRAAGARGHPRVHRGAGRRRGRLPAHPGDVGRAAPAGCEPGGHRAAIPRGRLAAAARP